MNISARLTSTSEIMTATRPSITNVFTIIDDDKNNVAQFRPLAEGLGLGLYIWDVNASPPDWVLATQWGF